MKIGWAVQTQLTCNENRMGRLILWDPVLHNADPCMYCNLLGSGSEFLFLLIRIWFPFLEAEFSDWTNYLFSIFFLYLLWNIKCLLWKDPRYYLQNNWWTVNMYFNNIFYIKKYQRLSWTGTVTILQNLLHRTYCIILTNVYETKKIIQTYYNYW